MNKIWIATEIETENGLTGIIHKGQKENGKFILYPENGGPGTILEEKYRVISAHYGFEYPDDVPK